MSNFNLAGLSLDILRVALPYMLEWSSNTSIIFIVNSKIALVLVFEIE